MRTSIKRALRPWVHRTAAPAISLPPTLWGLERGANGALSVGPHDLDAIAHRFGTPLHVFDAARLRANVLALDGLELFYSYKTHPIPSVLRQLHAVGAGAEVISEMELDLALRLGVPPHAIIYNGPAKSDRSLRTAIENDICLLNLNHPEELPRVVRVAREVNRRARIGVRVNTTAGWSGQFGTSMSDGRIVSMLSEIMATPEVSLEGLHSHRGVLLHSVAALEQFLGEVLEFVDRLHARLGWTPSTLDLGGSLAIPTVRSLSPRDRRLSQTFGVDIGGPDVTHQLTLRDYSATIRSRVNAHFRRVGRPSPRIVSELGRAITGNCQLMLASVVSLRDGGDGPTMAILDAGINLAGILRGERHQIFRVGPSAQLSQQMYRLVGPICQPGDILVNALRLPELQVGDVLAIMDAGAYFEADSTVFSFPRPGTVMIDGDVLQVLRRAETLDDVTSRDVF